VVLFNYFKAQWAKEVNMSTQVTPAIVASVDSGARISEELRAERKEEATYISTIKRMLDGTNVLSTDGEVAFFDTYLDCPKCGAVRSVYATTVLGLGRCVVCYKRSRLPEAAKRLLNANSYITIK
jgi:hypothetical protein